MGTEKQGVAGHGCRNIRRMSLLPESSPIGQRSVNRSIRAPTYRDLSIADAGDRLVGGRRRMISGTAKSGQVALHDLVAANQILQSASFGLDHHALDRIERGQHPLGSDLDRECHWGNCGHRSSSPATCSGRLPVFRL